MPLPKGTKYRFKKGTHTRLAFDKSGDVIEAKKIMPKKTKGQMQADELRRGGS